MTVTRNGVQVAPGVFTIVDSGGDTVALNPKYIIAIRGTGRGQLTVVLAGPAEMLISVDSTADVIDEYVREFE